MEQMVVHPEELAECDTVLHIPHKGSVESLNSAIAAAIILYEASKQRPYMSGANASPIGRSHQ